MARQQRQTRQGRKYRVCPLCGGAGTVAHPALSVWTQSDIEADEEAFAGYLEGRYDQPCPRCEGQRVVEDTKAEREAWREREEDRRTYAYESGQYDLLHEPY